MKSSWSPTDPNSPASPVHGFAADASGALCSVLVSEAGLTKREYFAALALQALLAANWDEAAAEAVVAADALIEALNK